MNKYRALALALVAGLLFFDAGDAKEEKTILLERTACGDFIPLDTIGSSTGRVTETIALRSSIGCVVMVHRIFTFPSGKTKDQIQAYLIIKVRSLVEGGRFYTEYSLIECKGNFDKNFNVMVVQVEEGGRGWVIIGENKGEDGKPTNKIYTPSPSKRHSHQRRRGG